MRTLADRLWHRRSRMGKVAVLSGAALALLLIIGYATPASEDETPEQPAAGQTATDPAEAATEETATILTLDGTNTPPLVARVIDGDTLELVNGRRIRLVQIDAPEHAGECYGRKAGTVLRRLLPAGTRVRLQADPDLDRRDRFGRLLRYVFKGRTNVNLALVAEGAASVWFYDGQQGRYADQLLSSAVAARASRRGVWGACDATLDPFSAFTARAKAPEPPQEPPGQPASSCHPSYEGACLDPGSPDYDCEGGEGDGPDYTGFVRVVGPDDFELDRDGDGAACEAG